MKCPGCGGDHHFESTILGPVFGPGPSPIDMSVLSFEEQKKLVEMIQKITDAHEALAKNRPCSLCGCKPSDVQRSLEMARQNVELANRVKALEDALRDTIDAFREEGMFKCPTPFNWARVKDAGLVLEGKPIPEGEKS
jgi:hypothetical protein